MRLCQTADLKSQVQQCPVHVSTQMAAVGCHVSCGSDRLVAACGGYVTADEHRDTRNVVVFFSLRLLISGERQTVG